MEKLKFLKNTKTIDISDDDFFYMINEGGWLSPEKYLEPEDAKKINDAIKLIDQYKYQGIEEGHFEDNEY